MKSYTADEVRRAELPLLAAGVPLMARAAAALAEEVRTLLSSQGLGVAAARILVLAGAGNNGGDALFAAAALARDGASVTIVPTANRVHAEGLAAALAAGAEVMAGGDGAVALGDGAAGPVAEVDPVAVAQAAARSHVVIDGILGTGTSADPALRGRARAVVAAILSALRDGAMATPGDPAWPLVVAVDLPSGIGADDGAVPDPTVLAATITVTFGGCKTGLLREPGSRYAGRVIVADIGMGDELARVARGR